MSTEANSERLGETVDDRYRIVRLIGEGGMGLVYEAEDSRLRKRVALKILRAEFASKPDVLTRFEREAISMSRLDHPNVARVTDYGRQDDFFFLVMDLLEGESLRELLARRGALPIEEAIDIASQIAQALEAAHEQGIVHRDLKPDNVLMVQREGKLVAKVLDFGVAKLMMEGREPDSTVTTGSHTPLGLATTGVAVTRHGLLVGTPEYMAPEQAIGGTIDARVDIYALGVILFELIEGRRPFGGDDLTQILSQHLTVPVPSLTPRPGVLSLPIDRAISMMMAKDREGRPHDAKSTLSMLKTLSGESQIDIAERTTPSKSIQTLFGINIKILIAAVGLVFVSGAALLLAVVSVVRQPAKPATTISAEPAETVTVMVPVATTGVTLAELAQAEKSGPEALDAMAEAHPQEPLVQRTRLQFAVRTLDSKRALSSLRKLMKIQPLDLAENEISSAMKLVATKQEDALFGWLESAETGKFGPDAIYHLAHIQKGKWTPHAARSLKKPNIRSRASAALDITLDLRDALGCTQKKDLLQRAGEQGDRRTLQLLTPLTSSRGCGFLDLSDCYKCLRTDGRLGAAIRAIELREKKGAP